MRIIHGTTDFTVEGRTAVAIGKFDGIHLGHRRLLSVLAAKKKESLSGKDPAQNALQTCVFTFDPSPEAFFGGTPEKVLTTREEKRTIFASLGVDVLVEFPFNAQTAAIPAEEFVRRILVGQLHAAYVAAGPDLSFGYRGEGNFALLAALSADCGYETQLIPKVTWQGEEVSSTRIRQYVKEGRMEEAAACLGEPYSIRGIVRHGNAIGRTLQMPTLNLQPEAEKLLPPFGVYYSHVYLNEGQDADPRLGDVSTGAQRFEGMTNIGLRPTIHELRKTVLAETYVYQFSRDIYGRDVTIALLTFRRPEQKFDSLAALRRQMKKDISDGRIYHGLPG